MPLFRTKALFNQCGFVAIKQLLHRDELEARPLRLRFPALTAFAHHRPIAACTRGSWTGPLMRRDTGTTSAPSRALPQLRPRT